MATNNFLQWDPALTNAESDAVYLADTTRSGGALTGQLLPSPLGNKAFYQWSTFVAAFSEMMKDKGFDMSDADFATLVAQLTNVLTTADFEDSIEIVPYATSITFNAAAAKAFDLTLTGNVSTTNLANTSPGQILTFIVVQDGTGNRAFPWPPQLSFVAPICPQANSITIQQFIVRPSGQVLPLGPLLWFTASGLLIPPNNGSIVNINSNGTCSNQFSNLVEIVNASGGSITRNLYDATNYAGFTVNVKNLGSLINPVVVQAQLGQTIDGFPNYQVNPFNDITFCSIGAAGWVLI